MTKIQYQKHKWLKYNEQKEQTKQMKVYNNIK